MEPTETLPAALARLLDGRDLADKVGTTILVSAVDASGWPRMAVLSVGEVLAPDPWTVRIVMYAGSRTTKAVRDSGRALLVAVVDRAVHKVGVHLAEVEPPAAVDGAAHAWFRGGVAHADRDHVGYATVTHGIEYELHDPAPVLDRWRQQVRALAEEEET